MGRLDFRPARVRQTVSILLGAKRMQKPAWYEPIGDVPPPEILTRTLPVRHQGPPKTGQRQIRKPSKLFKPQQITYEEDSLRTDFFQDHPWELARPRLVIEDDGKDYQRWDWSESTQVGRPVGGESVIQRQRYLMRASMDETTDYYLKALPSNATQAEKDRAIAAARVRVRDWAYDLARKEFYEQRHEEEIEARVAREEAMAVGAEFAPGVIDGGMVIEDESFERWKKWAKQEAVLLEQQRIASNVVAGQGATTLEDELVVQPATEESTET